MSICESTKGKYCITPEHWDISLFETIHEDDK